jgi:pimeloyl-ACP methyl ester carboxylesterase
MIKVVLVVFALSLSVLGQVAGKVNVNGVELNYLENGQGESLILLHGGVGDMTAWEAQFEEFAKRYRVISYSRRYSFPNKNVFDSKYRPGISDAEDLKALIQKLRIKRVHLVGLSYGAFTGLIFAVKNPDMVASMVLAEPPAHQLIRDLPDGEQMYQGFLDQLKPVAEAFRKGDDRAALLHFNQLMGRDFAKMPEASRDAMLRNALALKAINLSPDPFPQIDKQRIRKLNIPTLMVAGEKADRIHKSVLDEIARQIPGAEIVVVPNSGHATPRDNPTFFNRAVLGFLVSNSDRRTVRRRTL